MSYSRIAFLEHEVARLTAERELMLDDIQSLEQDCQSLCDDLKAKDAKIDSLSKILFLHGVDVQKLTFSSPSIPDEGESEDRVVGDKEPDLRSSFL